MGFMGRELRAFVVLIGALLVVAIFTYPSWRPPPIEKADEAAFSELPDDLHDDFLQLPAQIQQGYLLMRGYDTQQALTLLAARLSPPEPLFEDPPSFEGATLMLAGKFAPMELSENDERDLPLFSELYTSAGDAAIYLFPDDRKLLRLENFQVVNGPELLVALSTHENPLTPADLGRDYIDLGPLRTATGNLNYDIPSELNVSRYRSVVIYDRTYGVLFAVAKVR